MSISCPGPNESVAARAGMPKTICVHGEVDGASLLPAGAAAVAAAVDVFVKVYSGHGASVPVAVPAGATQAAVTGQQWCATDVPVPSAANAAPGDPITVCFWQVQGGVVQTRGKVECFSLDAAVGGTDCCDECSGGSGSGEGDLEAEVGPTAGLSVTVPDGPHKGRHTAKRTARRVWELTLGKERFAIEAHGGRRLEVTGPKSSAWATAVHRHPFSATLPGAVFGAKKDVVVTRA